MKMTPGNIRWNALPLRKTDIYIVAGCFIVLGTAMILWRIFGM